MGADQGDRQGRPGEYSTQKSDAHPYEGAEASYTDGILTLNLPKAEHVKARTVKVVAKR